MDDRLSIQINHRIRDALHSRGWRDPDDFGLRVSKQLAEHVATGASLGESIGYALGSTKTVFFRVNEVSRDHFELTLAGLLQALQLGENSQLTSCLERFCRFAERQLAQELWKSRNDEGVLRSHLQTSLEAQRGSTVKELVTGRGRADIALVDPEAKEVIETKLWKGEQYFRQGLAELAEYLRTEGLRKGYYVVLDTSRTNELVRDKGTCWTEQVAGRTIEVHFVRISPSVPSKLTRGP